MSNQDNLNKTLGISKPQNWSEPEILNTRDKKSNLRINELLNNNEIINVYDSIDVAINELYFETYPAQKDNIKKQTHNNFVSSIGDKKSFGNWVYFPWNKSLIHFPDKSEYQQLRTSRNRNLITSTEQKKLLSATILIAGLSVGSNVVEALLSQGIGSHYILIDLDNIEPTNLNRIRAPFRDVGISKVDAIAKKISEVDPYIQISCFRSGLNKNNLSKIIMASKPQVLIDEMDDLLMKVELRNQCKTNSLPVIMATDNGDGAILDVERYDLDSDIKIFNGLIPDDILDKLKNGNLTRPEAGQLIGKYFVGFDRVSRRMIESLSEVGISLPSWPQLGSAAALSGLLASYATKKILLGVEFVDNRFEVSFEKLFAEI
jgi:molybdopterin/thiamine biosynthesis adenylyltransferase